MNDKDKDTVNKFEQDREQGKDLSHTKTAAPTKSPADANNVNKSQTVTRDGNGKPIEDLDEPVDTPATDEAMEVEGDPEEGHWKPSELAEQTRPRVIPARDRRAYLVDQALKNEAVNDEVHRREAEIINDGRDKLAAFLDPDRLREESLQSTLADLDRHTDEGAEKRAQSRQAIAEAREKRGDPSPVPGDISGGSGGGSRPENKGSEKTSNDRELAARR